MNRCMWLAFLVHVVFKIIVHIGPTAIAGTFEQMHDAAMRLVAHRCELLAWSDRWLR